VLGWSRIAQLLWNPKVRYHFYKSLELDQLHPVHFNIILLYIFTSLSRGLLFLGYPTNTYTKKQSTILITVGYDILNPDWCSQDTATCFGQNLIST
jgi:hypothetical protein